MPRIELELNSDLMVTDDGYVTLKISPDEGNSLSIESDGLMSVGSFNVDGWNSKSGQILQGLTIGQVSFYNKTPSNPSGRIAATGIVHRVFTSHGEKPGEELTGRMTKDYFRSDMDYCLPGDIFRVRVDNDDHYDYYLILKVDPRKEGSSYNPGNMIAQYVKLGTWGDLSEPADEWQPTPKPDAPPTQDDANPTTTGGTTVDVVEDLDDIQIGDRVVIRNILTKWSTVIGGQEETLSPSYYELDAVWFVTDKIPATPTTVDPSEVEKTYRMLQYKPNAWSLTYTTYYELIPEHYESIPDTIMSAPDFSSDAFYRKTTAFAPVEVKPYNWDAPNEYLKYYTRDFTREEVLYPSVNNVVNGMIDNDTGENLASDAHVRYTFSTEFPQGKYLISYDRDGEHTYLMKVYVYTTSNEYVKSESYISGSSSFIDLTLYHDANIKIVINESGGGSLSPMDAPNVHAKKYPTRIEYYVTTDNDIEYYVYSNYTQLNAPTTFVAGEYYMETDTYLRLITQPSDWEDHYTDYYTYESEKFIPVPTSNPVPEFVRGKYFEEYFEDGSHDKLVLEYLEHGSTDVGRTVELSEVYKAPQLTNDMLTEDTLVLLSNSSYWLNGKPAWGDPEDITRSLDDLVSPSNMSYSNGSYDTFYGTPIDDLPDRLRMNDMIQLSPDGIIKTNFEEFTLNATGASKAVMYAYKLPYAHPDTYTDADFQFDSSSSIITFQTLPMKFKGFYDPLIRVKFVFMKDNGESISVSDLTNVTLTATNTTTENLNYYTDEDTTSIWYVKQTPSMSDTTVTIARRTSATSDEIIRENVPIKNIDLYTEVASIVELHVGEYVTIADNATTWTDGETITEEESRSYTYKVIRRDLTSGLFTLNNGKSIERKYLVKLNRVEWTPKLTSIDIDTIKPDLPIYQEDDISSTEEGDG